LTAWNRVSTQDGPTAVRNQVSGPLFGRRNDVTVYEQAATVIEQHLRSTVLPGLGYRIRPMSDDELALDIMEALDAAGFEVVRKQDGS
jgi:hypothetical protein